MNALETSLGKSLRSNPNYFYYKFPDGMYNARPGDFLVGDAYGWNILEAKLLTASGNFPMSRWSAVQRGFCATTEATGGRYWLVIQYSNPKHLMAYRGALLSKAMTESVRSLTGLEDWGVPVPWVSSRWAVEAFLGPS